MARFAAYTTELAARLTDVPSRRISYWARSGVLVPEVAYESPPGSTRTLYSFDDLVVLRALGIVRDRFGLPIEVLREVADFLIHHGDTPWSEIRFRVRGKAVVLHGSSSRDEGRAEPHDESTVVIDLGPIATAIEQGSDLLAQRDPADIGQVERRRGVQNNRLVVKGTRIPVETILEYAEAGYSPQAIVESFPSLALGDVTAVLARQHAA